MVKELMDWLVDFDHKVAYKIIDMNTYQVKVFGDNVIADSTKSYAELPKNVKAYLKQRYPNIKNSIKELNNATIS